MPNRQGQRESIRKGQVSQRVARPKGCYAFWCYPFRENNYCPAGVECLDAHDEEEIRPERKEIAERDFQMGMLPSGRFRGPPAQPPSHLMSLNPVQLPPQPLQPPRLSYELPSYGYDYGSNYDSSYVPAPLQPPTYGTPNQQLSAPVWPHPNHQPMPQTGLLEGYHRASSFFPPQPLPPAIPMMAPACSQTQNQTQVLQGATEATTIAKQHLPPADPMMAPASSLKDNQTEETTVAEQSQSCDGQGIDGSSRSPSPRSKFILSTQLRPSTSIEPFKKLKDRSPSARLSPSERSRRTSREKQSTRSKSKSPTMQKTQGKIRKKIRNKIQKGRQDQRVMRPKHCYTSWCFYFREKQFCPNGVFCLEAHNADEILLWRREIAENEFLEGRLPSGEFWRKEIAENEGKLPSDELRQPASKIVKRKAPSKKTLHLMEKYPLYYPKRVKAKEAVEKGRQDQGIARPKGCYSNWCFPFRENQYCPDGESCLDAHSEDEIRPRQRELAERNFLVGRLSSGKLRHPAPESLPPELVKRMTLSLKQTKSTKTESPLPSKSKRRSSKEKSPVKHKSKSPSPSLSTSSVTKVISRKSRSPPSERSGARSRSPVNDQSDNKNSNKRQPHCSSMDEGMRSGGSRSRSIADELNSDKRESRERESHSVLSSNSDHIQSTPREHESINDKIELEKAKSVMDFAESMVDFSLPNVKSTPLYAAYMEAFKRLELVRLQILEKQIRDTSSSRHSHLDCHVAETEIKSPALPLTEIKVEPHEDAGKVDQQNKDLDLEYVQAKMADGSPLSAEEVKEYFINFGSIEWCLQTDSASTVIFRYCDPASLESALRFNHFIKRRPLLLIPKKKRDAASDHRSQLSFVAPDDVEETTPDELTRLISHIEELAGSVKKE